GHRRRSESRQERKERSSQASRFAEAINEERLKSPDCVKRIRRFGCSHHPVGGQQNVVQRRGYIIFGAYCRREFLPGFRERVAGQFGYWPRASRSWSLKSRTNHESRRADR